jgi:hypothetical protein
LNRHGDHRGELHERLNLWEEGTARDVRVVFQEEAVRQAEHLDPADFEAVSFEALDDIAAMTFLDAVGLEED